MELPLVNTVNAICFATLVSADNDCLTIDAILSLSQVHNTCIFITITNGLNKLNLFEDLHVLLHFIDMHAVGCCGAFTKCTIIYLHSMVISLKNAIDIIVRKWFGKQREIYCSYIDLAA